MPLTARGGEKLQRRMSHFVPQHVLRATNHGLLCLGAACVGWARRALNAAFLKTDLRVGK